MFLKHHFFIGLGAQLLAEDDAIDPSAPLVLGGSVEAVKRSSSVAQQPNDMKRRRSSTIPLCDESGESPYDQLDCFIYDTIAFTDDVTNQDCILIIFSVVMNTTMNAKVVDDGM